MKKIQGGKGTPKHASIEEILTAGGKFRFNVFVNGFILFMISAQSHPAAPNVTVTTISIINLMFNFVTIKKNEPSGK